METRVSFANQMGENLVATLHLPENPTTIGIVTGHCFTCSRHTRILIETCKALAAAGFMALRFDFSGNGQSDGGFSESSYTKHIGEMRTAMDFLQGEGCRWFGLAGHSMGAAIAMLTGTRDERVKAVCTLAGRYETFDAGRLLDRLMLKELADTGRVNFVSRGRQLALDRHFFEDAAGHDPGRAAAEAEFPILAVHGDQDEIIPVEEAQRAKALNPEQVTVAIIKSCDHMFSRDEHRKEIVALVTEWFSARAAQSVA